jgi:hypothetical protein
MCLVQGWSSLSRIPKEGEYAILVKCCSCDVQHLSSYKVLAAPGKSSCRGSSILAPRNLVVAALLANWLYLKTRISKVASGEDLHHGSRGNSCVVVEPVDQIAKWVKPTPSKSSTYGDVVTLITTVQQIMEAPRTAETEDKCFTVNLNVEWD